MFAGEFIHTEISSRQMLILQLVKWKGFPSKPVVMNLEPELKFFFAFKIFKFYIRKQKHIEHVAAEERKTKY